MQHIPVSVPPSSPASVLAVADGRRVCPWLVYVIVARCWIGTQRSLLKYSSQDQRPLRQSSTRPSRSCANPRSTTSWSSSPTAKSPGIHPSASLPNAQQRTEFDDRRCSCL